MVKALNQECKVHVDLYQAAMAQLDAGHGSDYCLTCLAADIQQDVTLRPTHVQSRQLSEVNDMLLHHLLVMHQLCYAECMK